MEAIDREGPMSADGSPGQGVLRRLRLRFDDAYLESAFRADMFRHNLGNIRFAFLAGIALWVSWGLLLRPHMLALADLRLDALLRFGFFIPILIAGFVLSFTSIFARVWEWVAAVIAAATLLVWVFYASQVQSLPAEYGYVGVILITAFTYTLLRLRFVFVVLITVVGIAAYLPYALTASYIAPVSAVLAALYLVSFGLLGGMAAFRMERFTRDLFLRERQLDQERARSDGLLLNILPQAIVEQLKTSPTGRIAQAFDQVSVVFADAVGSTGQAARSTPEEFADALDELFRTFDAIADRHGLEKIKTIGDAYMAVAGVPVPMGDHTERIAELALAMLDSATLPIRIGIDTGPVVAGVIGESKFIYDLWGDAVTTASRMEAHGIPGAIHVTERVKERLDDDYRFRDRGEIEVKGRGRMRTWLLEGRRASAGIVTP